MVATVQVGEHKFSIVAPADMPPEEFRANVQLMASSPALLSTLREIEHTCWEEQRNPNSLGALAAIRQSAHNATETARPI